MYAHYIAWQGNIGLSPDFQKPNRTSHIPRLPHHSSVKSLRLRSITSSKQPISTPNVSLYIEQNAEKELHDSNHLDDVHTLPKSSALSKPNFS